MLKRIGLGLTSVCSSCVGRDGTRGQRRHQRLQNDPLEERADEEYILPNGNLVWDPSSKTFSSRKTDAGGLGYVPPEVPKSEESRIPTVEEFKLLKTLGKGAFGKVYIPLALGLHREPGFPLCANRSINIFNFVPSGGKICPKSYFVDF